MGNETWETLYSSLYKDAAAKAAYAEANSEVGADSALSLKRKAETLQIYQNMLQSADLHPTERAKLQTEVVKLESEILENIADTKLSGAKTTQAQTDTNKTQQEIDLENQRQALLNTLQGSPGTQLEDLNLGTMIKALGSGPTQDFRSGQISDARIREIETKQLDFQKHQKAYAALSRINTDEASAADVDEWNENSPDEATFGVIWSGETEWLDGISDDTPVQVTLPRGYTMADVRHSAELRGMTTEQVLHEIWKKGQ